MAHQFNIFILLFGALQGWLLSAWFIRNRKKDRSYLFLAVLLFVVSLQLISKVITKMWLMENAMLFYQLSYKLPYLVSPLLMLYSRSKNDQNFKLTDSVHLLPFIFSCFMTLDPLRLRLQPHPYTDCVLQLISLAFYSYLSFRRASKELKQFIRAVATAESVIIVTLALMVMYYGRFPDVRLLFIVLTILIYWITYKVISRTQEFKDPAMERSLPVNSKYAHSSLKVEEAQRIEILLTKMMTEERLYLDPELTIDSLAAKLSSTRHHVSQVINERLNKTYADLLNDYRLEECRRRLTDRSNDRFTIAAIAKDSGFTSVSGFNEVFKKRYGQTPSRFRQMNLDRMSA